MSDLVGKTGVLLSAVFLAAATVLAGCASVEPANPSFRPGEADVRDFAALFVEGYAADFEPADTTSELGSVATLVVFGTVVEVSPGRYFGSSLDDPILARTIVLRIDNLDVLSGYEGLSSKNELFVELPAPYNFEAPVFDAKLPKGAAVIMYLEPALTNVDTPILDDLAGRPAEEPLWQLVSPQGFFMDSKAGATMIMLGTQTQESLENLGPDDATAIPDH